MHIDWFEYCQIISLCIAIYCWKGLKACSLLAFIPFLVIVNITELTARNYLAFGWTSNYFIYQSVPADFNALPVLFSRQNAIFNQEGIRYIFYCLRIMHAACDCQLWIYSGIHSIQYILTLCG